MKKQILQGKDWHQVYNLHKQWHNLCSLYFFKKVTFSLSMQAKTGYKLYYACILVHREL